MTLESISVVIPAYNEADCIQNTLCQVHDYLCRHFSRHEIIVVDDGSTDSTREKVLAMPPRGIPVRLILNGKNSGKGFSVKTGVLAADSDYVLFSDADLSTPIDEAGRFVSCLRAGTDVVLGSRALHDSQVIKRQGFLRRNMGRTFNILIQIMLFKGIKDTQCGFKCFKGQVAQDLFKRQRLAGFCFDVEILFIARKLHYSCEEIPVRWINREASRVAMVKDSLKMFFDLFKIKINDFRGRYESK
ncbi:MAG: dolichyl-phosphate beta-glucosyltransferase [Candidatus Omnitrophota bacterium]